MTRVFVLLALLLVSRWALAADVVTLKLAETWGPDYPIFGEATKNFAGLASELSAGRLVIEIDSADVHKQPLGVFDLVKSGQYDLGHSASYYWTDIEPNTQYFSTMPFGMIASEQYSWFYFDDGMALMDEVYAPHNLYSFPGGNTGQQMGGWFQKEIVTPEDLNGLRMRIPGFAGEIMAELGVEPVNLPSGELYQALIDNRIDALEWVGPSLDLSMGFSQAAEFYYTGWHEPATELQFLANRQVFDALPSDLREILTLSMRLAAYDMWVQSQHESAKNWETMLRENPNIKVRQFSDDVMTLLRAANERLLSEKAEQDPLAARIIASQQAYLNKARAWIDISERAYTGNMDARGNRTR